MANRNEDIRKMIDDANVKYWEVAEIIGIAEGTFSVWLRHELSEDRRTKIINAINKTSTREKEY